MARVEGIPPNTPAWDGRTSIPVPPEAAHVLKDRGIEVFRRNVTNRDRIRNGVPAEWMRKDAAPFLQEVQDGGSGGFAEQPRWVWCAPTAVAILVRGGRESGWESTHDDHLAVALWAVDNAGFKALEQILDRRIAETFGTIFPLPGWLKNIDSRILKDERHAVMVPSEYDWSADVLEKLGVRFWTWTGRWPWLTKRRFLRRHRRLTAMVAAERAGLLPSDY